MDLLTSCAKRVHFAKSSENEALQEPCRDRLDFVYKDGISYIKSLITSG